MLRCAYTQRRWAHRRGGFVTGGTGWSQRRAPAAAASAAGAKKSEWWAVDGEMHEIGEGVPHRERFAIPRDNLPNRRRKQMREQFMRRTRLVLKDTEHEAWCKKYMELYQEIRENWERLYWDEGYSKKIAEDHANYDSAEEDDLDFSPYSRRRRPSVEQNKDVGFGASKQGETWERVTQIRDKFEYDRERRMRERAFAPMSMENNFGQHESRFRNQHDSNHASTNIESRFDSDDQAFGNRPNPGFQQDSSFRNRRDLDFQNESSFRSRQYPNFQNQRDPRNRMIEREKRGEDTEPRPLAKPSRPRASSFPSEHSRRAAVTTAAADRSVSGNQMVRVSVLNDALKTMYNAEKRGKRQVMIRPSSKVIIKFLIVMQKHGYIGEFEFVDDHRSGKIVVELNGRLNKCGVISPRFDVGVKEIESWTARLLPSRQFGYIVLTTSAGIMDHEEARRKNVGGKVLGFFY
uniref:Small ribosomal subunit protein uS8c n=1 Tax=Leersia perrieri TaxID=77586 RepID=A0A0D9VFZ1_9ORYZ